MKKKILIFGGSGFLGKNLINRLLKKKIFFITSVSRTITGKKNLQKRVKYVKCDLSDVKNLKIFTKKNFDIVINLSGNINHQNLLETNTIHNRASKNIFSFFAKKKINLFIQIGTSLEYGNGKSPQIESFRCSPKSYYGKSKLFATRFIEESAKKNKIQYLILRLYQVYGPYQKFDRLIPFVIKNSLMDKKFNCSPGNQLRDFLFVDDLTNLFIKILKKKKVKSGIYNVGYGKSTKVRQVIEKINKIIKKGQPLFGKIKMRKDEVNSLYPNIKKVKQVFKWQPKTNLYKGLKKTINFYEKTI